MGDGFQAVLLEGVFFLGEDPYPDAHGTVREGFLNLWVKLGEQTPRSVYEALRPFLGERVRFAAHHVPQMPLDPGRWGGGSCLWEPGGHCPYGHHSNPTGLFNFTGEGVLVYDLDHGTCTGGWWLEQFDGNRTMLPLAHALSGHHGRVAVATAMTVEDMRASLEEAGDVGSVEAIGEKVADLRDLVERLAPKTRED
jgi:hypothetical protein